MIRTWSVQFGLDAWFACLVCGLVWVAACGGNGSLEGTVYEDAELSYEFGRLGEDWERLRVDDRTDAAWSHERLASVIQINSSCNPALDIPLDALTRHLTIGFTERHVEDQKRIPMDAREALRTHMKAKLDGVPRELMLIVLKKDGCVYDFALIAPPDDRFDEAREDYLALLDGFRVRRSRQ